jgi:hypothetical protein
MENVGIEAFFSPSRLRPVPTRKFNLQRNLPNSDLLAVTIDKEFYKKAKNG